MGLRVVPTELLDTFKIILYTYYKSQAVFRTLHGYWSVFIIYNEQKKRKMLRTGEMRTGERR